MYSNFHESLLKKILTYFLGQFWLVKGKMKMKMKNKGKWVRFLNSPYQNQLMWQFSQKPVKKNLTHFLRHFWLIKGKKDEDEKIWDNDFKLWILHIKIKLCDSFYENLRKNFWWFCKTFLTNWGNNEDENEKIRENYFEF